MPLPRPLVTLFSDRDGSEPVAVGEIDLTPVLLSHGIAWQIERDLRQSGRDGDVWLPLHFMPHSWPNLIVIKDLPNRSKEFWQFIDAIGGLDNISAWVKAATKIVSLRRSAEQIDGAGEGALKADDEVIPRRPEDVCMCWWAGEFGEASTLLERFADDYRKGTPFPFDDDAAMAEWHAGYRGHLAEHAPPCLFASEEIHWAGVSAADIREEAEEARLVEEDEKGSNGESKVGFEKSGDILVAQIIECDLSDNHHEDAIDVVVDASEIEEIVREWLPHAGSGTPEDLTLEGKVAAWNAKQTLSSYFETNRLIAVADGATKDAMLAWCTRQAQARRDAADAIERDWAPPLVESAAAELHPH